MKKIFMLIIMVLFIVPAFSASDPASQGNFIVTVPLFQYGTGSGELYENDDGDQLTGWTVGMGSLGNSTVSLGYPMGVSNYDVGIQYFVFNGLAIGADFGYSKIKMGDSDFSTTTFGPTAAYYLNFGNILPYAGVDFIMESVNSNVKSGDIPDGKGTSITLKGGVAFMLGEKYSLFGEASYGFDELEIDHTDKVKGKWLAFTAGAGLFL